jgi:hypothetical protein
VGKYFVESTAGEVLMLPAKGRNGMSPAAPPQPAPLKWVRLKPRSLFSSQA